MKLTQAQKDVIKSVPGPGDCPYCHKPAGSYECQRSHP